MHGNLNPVPLTDMCDHASEVRLQRIRLWVCLDPAVPLRAMATYHLQTTMQPYAKPAEPIPGQSFESLICQAFKAFCHTRRSLSLAL